MAYGKGPKREIIFHSALAERGPTRITVDDQPRYLKSKDRDVVELTIGNDRMAYFDTITRGVPSSSKGRREEHTDSLPKGARRTPQLLMSAKRRQPRAPQEGATAGRTSAPATAPQPAGGLLRASPPAAKKGDKVDRLIEGMVKAGQFGVALQLAAKQCIAAAEGFCKSQGVPSRRKARPVWCHRLRKRCAPVRRCCPSSLAWTNHWQSVACRRS